MVSNKFTASTSRPQKQLVEAKTDGVRTLLTKLEQLIDQIIKEKKESVKEKFKRNRENVERQISTVMSEISRRDSLQTEENINHIFSSRIDNPICNFRGFGQGASENDHIDNQNRISEVSIKISYLTKLPPYTSWVHMPRNQRMRKDQSVIGKKQIYYEKHGGETTICSDPEEEIKGPEEVKHEFSEGEDRVLWMAFGECGLDEEVLNIVRLFIQATDTEIQERYEILKGRTEDSGGEPNSDICLEKSLSAALACFDNFFCRRCMQIFDCPLHGCSQPLIYPSDKQPVWSGPEGDREPCSDQCYLRLKDVNILPKNSFQLSFQDRRAFAKEPSNKSTKASLQEERCNYVPTPFATKIYYSGDPNSDMTLSENMKKRTVINLDESRNFCKKLKGISNETFTANSIGTGTEDQNLDASLKSLVEHTSNLSIFSDSTCNGEEEEGVEDGQNDVTNVIEFMLLSNSSEGQAGTMPSISDWKLLEKELYLKGVEMFGRNSCLIARNLLPGLKTCMEIAAYMNAGGESVSSRSIPGPIMDKIEKTNTECTEQEMPSKPRSQRKRGKPKKYNYSRKSAGLPPILRRIAYRKTLDNKQYTPCGCPGMCGKQCPCFRNGSCCEKYCGCGKLCKNRFRGCHCAKSQCRSRLCPCFAANRECDPDVCRNCWISCGDGSLGEPPRKGDGQCGNMRLLLGQKQRILLAKSDVAGWGTFLKNPVKKNECLGEYTGELISQIEAEKRGKLYDITNSSFLFDLNDQFVVDANRKGDKLKFANHSKKPNCYPKVMLVAGDHRIGIFAGENIEAGEELFYDYSYGPEQSPQWILELNTEESPDPQTKTKRRQSR